MIQAKTCLALANTRVNNKTGYAGADVSTE
jgi:hypothetical protein